MVTPELQQKKEAAIKEAVNSYYAQNKYKIDWIMEQVAAKFFLSPATVRRIYFGEYDRKRERVAEVKYLASRGIAPPPPRAPVKRKRPI